MAPFSLWMSKDEKTLYNATLFKNINVWAGIADDVTPGVDVLVVGNKIQKVAKDIPTSCFSTAIHSKVTKSSKTSSA